MKTKIENEISFSDIQTSTLNSSFDKATVRIACAGDNRNGSSISLEAYAKALPSLKNIPIVALYKDDEHNFGGHETDYEIEDGNFKVVYNTHPFGVIHESAKQWYETVEEDGVEKTYLLSECLLWKRQKSYKLLKEKGRFSVSMEIEVKDGGFDQYSSIYKINDFIFTAVAVLGEGVEPCFKSAEIRLFSENKEYMDMLNEYKNFSLEHFKGGEEMEDVVKVEETTIEVKEETSTIEEESKVEEVESKTKEVEETTIEYAEVKEDGSVDLPEMVEVETPEVNEDGTIELPETIETEMPKLNEDGTIAQPLEDEVKTPVEQETIELVAKYEALVAEYEALQVEYGKVVSSLQANEEEFARLKKFEEEVLKQERTQKEEEVFSKFTMIEDSEEFKELKANASKYSLEELENMCYTIVGRMAFSKKDSKAKVQKSNSTKLNFSAEKQENKTIHYGGILG